MPNPQKTYEIRLRRMAERQGFYLTKSRRRDPRALGFGNWRILDKRGKVVVGGEHGASLDDVEEWLTNRQERPMTCSLCGKSQDEVVKLVVNGKRTAAVCDECARLCVEMADQELQQGG